MELADEANARLVRAVSSPRFTALRRPLNRTRSAAVALANGWIIINVGGGPTEDKPTVTLETPPDPDRTSSFLNIRVADVQAIYAEWSAGSRVPHAPKDRGGEIRCC